MPATVLDSQLLVVYWFGQKSQRIGGNVKFPWRRTARLISDSEFGNIEEWKRGCWRGNQLNLWDYHNVQVLLDADENGPSPEQRSFLRLLRGNAERIRERIEEAVHRQAAKTPDLMVSAMQPIKLATIFLPKNPPHEPWRVWYDMEGEEVYWFGAEIRNSHQIVPFTED